MGYLPNRLALVVALMAVGCGEEGPSAPSSPTAPVTDPAPAIPKKTVRGPVPVRHFDAVED